MISNWLFVCHLQLQHQGIRQTVYGPKQILQVLSCLFVSSEHIRELFFFFVSIDDFSVSLIHIVIILSPRPLKSCCFMTTFKQIVLRELFTSYKQAQNHFHLKHIKTGNQTGSHHFQSSEWESLPGQSRSLTWFFFFHRNVAKSTSSTAGENRAQQSDFTHHTHTLTYSCAPESANEERALKAAV